MCGHVPVSTAQPTGSGRFLRWSPAEPVSRAPPPAWDLQGRLPKTRHGSFTTMSRDSFLTVRNARRIPPHDLGPGGAPCEPVGARFRSCPLHSGVCAARDRSHFRVSRMHGAWSDNFVRRRRTAVDATIPLRARCAATPLGEQHRQSEFAERGSLRYILRAPNPAQFLISSEFHI